MNKQTANRLTTQQLDVLILTYRFRFIHARHVHQFLMQKHPQNARRILSLLIKKGYLFQFYSPMDHFGTAYATYCLTPQGIQILRNQIATITVQNTKHILHDRKATATFRKDCVMLADFYFKINEQYKNELTYFSKTELTRGNYFTPLPVDAYYRIGNENYIVYLWRSQMPKYRQMHILKDINQFIYQLNVTASEQQSKFKVQVIGADAKVIKYLTSPFVVKK